PCVPTPLSRFQEKTVPTGLRQGSPFRPLASSRQRHDKIHATIDFDLGPRPQDGRRLTLFDDGGACEALADHQAIAVVHRILDERPSFGEVCGTPPFLVWALSTGARAVDDAASDNSGFGPRVPSRQFSTPSLAPSMPAMQRRNA